MFIIFDCDGVLVDSEIIAARVDAEHLKKVGYEITPEEVIQRFAGLTSRDIVTLIEAELGRPLPEDFLEEQKEELDRRLAAEVQPVPGVFDLLDRLDRTGDPRAIGSNSSGERLRMELEKTRLYDRFAPHIFSAVEVGERKPKPAPDVYLHATEKLGFWPRDTIVVEDSAFGVRAAVAAGCRVVGFTGGAHTWPGHADILTEAGAETVIRRFADLPKVAEALMAWRGLVDQPDGGR